MLSHGALGGRWWKGWPAGVGLRHTPAQLSARRPLAYSTLADLVHHVRQHLPLSDLSLAVQLFAKNIDDESLPSSIQTMSCKLLLNLVDCIRSKSEQESGNGRDVLMRMLEVPSRERPCAFLPHTLQNLHHCFTGQFMGPPRGQARSQASAHFGAGPRASRELAECLWAGSECL